MKHTNRIWILMGKKLSASITPVEEKELESLLIEDPELWYSYELVQGIISLDDVPEEFINEIKILLFDKQVAPENLNNLLLNKLESPVTETFLKPASKSGKHLFYASAFVFAIILAWFGTVVVKSTITKSSTSAMNEIIAPKGSKTQITLADGTTIWLNAGSRLLYPKNFSLENREVYLTGEAYFKVVHNDIHSFVVHTPHADIKDLGTTFNVKAYLDNETTETTLIEGSVEVILKNNPTQKILIQPKEKLVLHNKQVSKFDIEEPSSDPIFEVSKIVPFAKTNDIVETAWVSNKLIFRNERFEDIAKEMERRYNVTIIVRDDDVKDYQLTGIFKNENIVEALQLLQVIAPFKFKINNNEIYIDK